MTRTSATYEAGSWARCDATDGETFGVDHGATRGGYEIGETLQNNINFVSSDENGLVVEFGGDGDIGASTHLDDGDEMVSVTGCIDDPDEPGWYQITGTTSGVTADGEEAHLPERLPLLLHLRLRGRGRRQTAARTAALRAGDDHDANADAAG